MCAFSNWPLRSYGLSIHRSSWRQLHDSWGMNPRLGFFLFLPLRRRSGQAFGFLWGKIVNRTICDMNSVPTHESHTGEQVTRGTRRRAPSPRSPLTTRLAFLSHLVSCTSMDSSLSMQPEIVLLRWSPPFNSNDSWVILVPLTVVFIYIHLRTYIAILPPPFRQKQEHRVQFLKLPKQRPLAL
jgi:hypothetical protein